MWTCSSCRRRCQLHAASALAHAVSACSQWCLKHPTARNGSMLPPRASNTAVHLIICSRPSSWCVALRAEEAADGASDLQGAGTKSTNPFVLDLGEEEAINSGYAIPLSGRILSARSSCVCTAAVLAHFARWLQHACAPWLLAYCLAKSCTQGGGSRRRRQAGCSGGQGGRWGYCGGGGRGGHGAADDGRAVARPKAALRLAVRGCGPRHYQRHLWTRALPVG